MTTETHNTNFTKSCCNPISLIWSNLTEIPNVPIPPPGSCLGGGGGVASGVCPRPANICTGFVSSDPSSLPLSPRQLKLQFDQTNNIFDTCLLGAHGSNLGKKYLDTQFGTNVVTVISPHQAQSSGPAPGWLVVIVIEIL